MTFEPNQKVMVRRLGDGKEYRGRVVGLHSEHDTCSFYIIEMIDRIANSKWSHAVHITSCLDAEEWAFDNRRDIESHVQEEMDRVYGKDVVEEEAILDHNDRPENQPGQPFAVRQH